jgi:outer membrane receptor protein involved in Fe transport
MHRHSSTRGIPAICTAVAFAIAAAQSSLAHAQEAPQGDADMQEVHVSGSRIVRRDLDAPSPVVTVEQQAFNETGTLAVESVLNQLPQFVPANTQFQANDTQPGPTNTPGAASLNLRGLGTNRTLVLIDGRRAQPANASLVIDTNTIPAAAIDSVEVISGGASAVYGADALAGVVNFKLRDNFQGATFEARGGVSEAGDAEEYRFNSLLGMGIGSRGNVMVGLEYSRRGTGYKKDRDFFTRALTDSTVNGTSLFLLSPSYEVGGTAAGGIVTGNAPSQAAVNALFPDRGGVNIATSGRYYFNEDNSIFKTTNGGIGFKGPIGTGQYKIAPGNNLAENDLNAWMSTPLERFSMFGRARYELSDKVRAFSQLMFVSTSVRTLHQPSPASGTYGAAIPYGNGIYQPSRNPTTNATLPQYLSGGSLGLNCPATGGCTMSQAFPVTAQLASLLDSRGPNVLSQTQYDPNSGLPVVTSGVDSAWRLSQSLTFLPSRSVTSDTQLYQLMAGFEGELGVGDWTWEAYASRGQTRNDTSFRGFASEAMYRAIAQAPNYGRSYSANGVDVGRKEVTCTSGLPVFQQFEVSQDCIDAITLNAADRTDLTQDIFEANLQGALFNLPAGELRGALGVDYRRDEFEYTPDVTRDIDYIVDANIGAFGTTGVTGETSVKEIYGELLVPLLRDKPFVRSLELELGARYSDYNLAGGEPTYKALFSWSPTDFVRFRGGYQLATRAPNINELFLASSNVATMSGNDPCRTADGTVPWGNVASNPNRAKVQALCSAIIGSGNSEFDQDPNNFLQPISDIEVQQGNRNLRSEQGTTYTLGMVLTSPFEAAAARNIAVSVDYYQAHIKDAIQLMTGATTYDLCFNRDGTSNPAYSIDDPLGMCGRIDRDASTGAKSRVYVPYTNIGTLETSGIDLAANWRASLDDLGFGRVPGMISLDVSLNYVLQFEAQDFPTQPKLDVKGTNNYGGIFDYRTVTTLRYLLGGFNAGLNWRYLPSLKHATYPTNHATASEGTAAYNIFNLSGGYEINETVAVSGGVDNLFGKEPPVYGATSLSTGAGTTLPGFYDTLGRYYYLSARMKF